MMKRIIPALLAALLIPVLALAEANDFELQDRKIMKGMDQSWWQGYEPTVSDDRVTICLPLTSEKTSGKITATLVLQNPELSPFAKEKLSEDFWIDDNGLYAVRLRLPLVSGRHNGDYAANVVITGTDKDKNALRSEFPVVIRIRDGRKDGILPGLSSVTSELAVGENGAVNAVLTNTSRYAEMKDIALIVKDADGDILPAGWNRLFLGSLMPGESRDFSYPVAVKPDAAAALHTLSFKLLFTALDEPITWEEDFTLPVTQAMRLEHGELQTPASVVQGDAAVITLPIMNMGRGELRNVFATLSMPGAVERQSVLLGSIAPGETKPAKISVKLSESIYGETGGQLTVTAEDDWSNETSFTLPVSLQVEKAPEKQPEIKTTADYVKTAVPVYVWPLSGGFLLMLLALIIQGALLRGKIHRLEEDKL